jgi:hypothetical protein
VVGVSLTYNQSEALYTVEENTQETVKILRSMNKKMDKQIALLEQMVEILKERRTDADY